MPPIRPANHLCPVCLKGYNTDFWLSKHIDQDHPRYRHQLAAKKQLEQRASSAATPTTQRGANTVLKPPSTTPPVRNWFFVNHNTVDDPDALLSTSLAPPARDNQPELDQVESQLSNTDSQSALPTNAIHPTAGIQVAYVPTLEEHNANANLDDPLYPFGSEEEYNFAELVTLKGIPANVIDTMLKGNYGLDKGVCAALKSNYHLRQMIDRMEDGLGHGSWKKSELSMAWNEQHPDNIVFWHRDLICCARWILRQQAYGKHLVYAPMRCFNSAGQRVYDEMHTGDWWWETQSNLPDGDTLVPIIFMSDATHLTNFCGDKKAWPIYMTIGNLSAKARMQHTLHGVLLVALLPIPVKMREVPAKKRNTQREHNRMVMQQVLKHIMQDLLEDEGRHFYAYCADGKVRRCYPTLAAWMADYPEHCNLHNIKSGVCYWCECPQEKMGDHLRPADRYPIRNHTLYRQLWEQDTPQSIADLKSRNVNPGFNILWGLESITSLLPKPDLLHTMQIGMLKHLLGWLQEFLKQHKRLELFNDIWLSVPAYLDMSKPRCAYEEVARWNGGEIKTMTRFLVGVTRNTLRNPNSAQKALFESAVECTRSLVEFYMYCQYDSHDTDTLNLMEDALRRFHHTKWVFLQYRAGKRLTAEARDKRIELCAERDTELKANQNKSAAHRQRIRDAWKAIIDSEMAEFIEEGSDFNFPKIHLMQHFREQIQQFGSLKQWSTEIGETSHKKQIKDGFNSSNKTGDYYTQLINFYLRCDAFMVRRANTEALSGLESIPRVTVAAGEGSCARARLKFISPQLQKGKSKVNDFRGLLDAIADVELRKGIEDATQRFLVSRKINIESTDLMGSTAAIYHGVEVRTKDMHGEETPQRLRCTGDKGWYSGAARHDWVWVQIARPREGQELPYKALQGRLPYRMLRLFKLHVIHARGEETFWLAYVELTRPANGGMPEMASKLVRVIKPMRGEKNAVISAGNIVGAAHVIPEVPLSAEAENTGWVVNSHIDLATWNDIYYMFQEELEAVTNS